MHSIASASLIALSCVSTLVSAAPFSYPLSDGFPNITNPSAALTAIEQQAQGTLSNGGAPPPISAEGLTSLRLIAFNELSEVAFFTELVANITNNAPGYELADSGVRTFILNALNAVVAQEELHVLNANGALKISGVEPIQPCQYNFPVATFEDAINLASTFTDVVLGTLQDVESVFGANGDDALLRGVASVIGQEGEQNGYYRTLMNKIPSALPFLTTSTREFAFSALNQMFVVPGSCPNSETIDLPIFGGLNVLTQGIAATSQTLQFSFDISTLASGSSSGTKYSYGSSSSSSSYGNQDWSALSLVYINQQNLPVVEPLTQVSVQGNIVTFEAFFPYDQFLMNGLTIAAVTNTSGPFTSADAVAAATLFGPGLIEIN